MKIEDYNKYYIQGSDHYLIPKDVFKELFNEMINWKEESKKAKEVIDKIMNLIKQYGKYDGKKCTRGFQMWSADFNKILDILKRGIRMNKEEIEELKDFTIDLTDIDELALGLEVCSKKSNMVIQEFADTIIQLQQENQKYKEVIDKLKNKTKENIENAKCEITALTIGDKAYYQYIEKILDNYVDILKEVE